MRGRGALALAWMAALLAAWLPSARLPGLDAPPADFPGWPAALEGRPLVPRQLDARELAFFATFPGRVGRFGWGRGEALLRFVAAPTRRLHGADECYRALGWELGPTSVEVDPEGRRWNRFEVSRDGRRLRVRERITGSDGSAQRDPSAWYWEALTGSSVGPWWAVTLAEPADR